MNAAIAGLTGTVGGWGPFVAGLALKSTALLLLAAFTAAGLRRSSAAARHLVWALAIGGLLLLPLAPAVLPSWETSAPDWLAPLFERASPDPVDPSFGQMALDFPAPPAGRAEPDRSGGVGRTWAGAALVWLLVSTSLLLRVAWGHLKHIGVMRRARLQDGRIASVARELAVETGVRPVPVYEGEPDAMPCAWGFTAPTVLLPSSAAGWSPDRLRSVLVHELAHVRRHDCGIQLLAEVVRAIYWPHPLVWLAVGRLRAESEGACDNVVIAAGARPSTYATDLLEIARSLRPGPHAAVVGMARKRLDDRVRALLDDGRSRAPVARSTAIPAVALSVTLVLLVALVRPVVGGAAGSTNASNSDCSTVLTEENMNARRLIAPLVVAASFGCREQAVVPEAGAPGVESRVDQARPPQSGIRRVGLVNLDGDSIVFLSVPPGLEGAAFDSFVLAFVRARADSLRSGSVVRPPTNTPWTPTYARDIAPLLQSKCEGCHRMGGDGPMTFDTYEQTRPWGPLIGELVSEMVDGEAWHELRLAPGTRELHWRLAPDETYFIREWIRGRMPNGQ